MGIFICIKTSRNTDILKREKPSTDRIVHTTAFVTSLCGARGAGCSSVDSVPAFEAVGRRIDPSHWTQLQFGLFSVPTSGPQLVYQRPWYVLFCLWKSAYKRSLAAYRKE